MEVTGRAALLISLSGKKVWLDESCQVKRDIDGNWERYKSEAAAPLYFDIFVAVSHLLLSSIAT